MAPGTKLLLGIFCIAFLGLFQNVGGTGTIEVHFLLYTDDCDEDWHTNKCDPKFRFCLSTPQRGRLTVSSCNYASTRQSDDDFQNTNYINMEFRTSIGGLSNPWIVHVQRFIEPSVMLVIEAIDDDIFSDDHMQTWGKTLTETIWPDKEHAVWQERVMSQNSYTMKFKVRMYCDPYYYTTSCDKYCKPEDSSNGHYTCHPVTGDKICLPGWQGIRCTDDIDECALGYCVRGSCTNTPGDYSCSCPPNYTGKNCSTLMNACRYEPCQNNGTCFRHATEHLYICSCTPEWEGSNCETRKSPCRTNPCLNNGACVSSPGETNYTCSCVVPYTGANCETAVTTIQSSLQTETTLPQPSQTSTSGMANDTSSTTTESQDANVQQQLLQEEDEGGFQLWYIAIIIAVILLIFIVLAVLFIRRRKSKAEKSPSTPGHVITFIGNDLSFDNGAYATVNRVNSEIDKQTRQLPAVPVSRIPDDALKSTYACVDESDGATGGSKTDDSDIKKSASDCDKKTDAAGLGALTRPANERAQTNPYADFRLLRDSQVVLMNPSEGPQEEDTYHDLDDIAAQMHNDEDGQNDSADGTFSYIIPDTPIVTVQSSPYDTPPNNSSYYDTPKGNLPSPFVPEQNNNLTSSGNIADNDFSPYVNALDNDSDDDDDGGVLQEDILKLRNDVEANIPTFSRS